MNIYIYTWQTAHGILVIVEHLVASLQRKGVNCTHISTLEGRNIDDIIIPYGVKEANEVLHKGFRPYTAFMADAITLGYINKIKFYLRHLHFFHYDFLYSLYGYIRYTPQEKKVICNYQNAVFVSSCDINYLKKKYPNSTCKYICVANGAPAAGNIKTHVNSELFRIGLLSQWGLKTVYEESNWFIRSYWKKYQKKHNNVILRVAGRGDFSKKFVGLPGVEVVGEVADLGDFFASCDVSLLLCPKGCGILNRVLDSFIFKVPVVGYTASFSGFPRSDTVCYKFSNYSSFSETMDYVINNPTQALERANKAFEYALTNHNWDNNYDILAETIINGIN